MMGMYGLSTAVQADTQMKNGKHQRVHVELRAPIRYQSLQRGCVNKFLIRWKHFLWRFQKWSQTLLGESDLERGTSRWPEDEQSERGEARMGWAGLEGLRNPGESPNGSLMKSFSGSERQLAQSSQFMPKRDRSRQRN